MTAPASGDVYEAILAGDVSLLRRHVANGLQPNDDSNSDRWNLLHLALVSPERKIAPEVIQFFVDIGVDVNAKDAKGWTPLHFAARMNRADILEILLKAGADSNAKHERGFPPISEILKARPPVLDAVEVLLRYGAKTEGEGYTARKLMETVARPDKHAILALFDEYRPVDNLPKRNIKG